MKIIVNFNLVLDVVFEIIIIIDIFTLLTKHLSLFFIYFLFLSAMF